MNKKTKGFDYYSGKKYDGMMGRCYRPTDRSYVRYGEKGIRVSESWIQDISMFRLWLLEEFARIGISVEHFVANSNKVQLDRIDPSGHYTASNCRLTSVQTNSRNKKKI